jgi:hypothetical protein
MANQVYQHFLRNWKSCNEEDGPRRYISLVVAYLNRQSKATLDVWEEEWGEDNGDEDDEDDEDDGDYEGDDGGGNDDDHDDMNEEERGDTTDDWEKTKMKINMDLEPQAAQYTNFRCVLCQLDYKSRETLTSHYEIHKKMRTGTSHLSALNVDEIRPTAW